ncbi:hypothetical protein [Paraflavitalea sp. CAU 1676]|uniref:hypothetical protein n=1 Tax=Paraflavitalea sp. CAU 1676 TaxID=3032598 RepID=UPI0023D9B4D6|nr:hypothetical protein [Paraflavitalea sp. CAU 1676]MDF2191685.1 hypothetical protein [Paraflavitalea sp. CAU 1676]
MKKTTLYYSLVGLIACTLLFSCKKDKDEDALKPPADRILGVWNVTTEIEKTYAYETGVFKDSSGLSIPAGAFTIDFRTDGKVYVKIIDEGSPEYDTVTYKVINEQELQLGEDTYTFKKFTNSDLMISTWYDDGSSNVENQLVMKK